MEELSQDFLKSLLGFCQGIQNILYTRLVPFLVRELFSRLILIVDESGFGIGVDISMHTDDGE